jgi:2-iminoacetate synthase ThiH
VVWRLPFRDGETDAERLGLLGALADSGLSLWGVLPAPSGEPYGLDTVRFMALARLSLPPAWHVQADVTALGPRLAQMCFGFGADELRAQIVAERALRLGANAGNTALTRREAVTLIRGAGLAAAERLGDGTLEEIA